MTSDPFPVVVDAWLRQRQGITNPLARPNISAFAREITGYSYEQLRQMCNGEAPPSPSVMEQTAALMGRDPRYFCEYRLFEICEAFDSYPDLEMKFYKEIMAIAEAKRKDTGAKSPDGRAPVSRLKPQRPRTKHRSS